MNNNLPVCIGTLQQDGTAACDFLKQLRRPDEVVEVRVLYTKSANARFATTRHALFTYDELDTLADVLKKIPRQGFKGIYYTLNPIKTGLHKTAPTAFVEAERGSSAKDTDATARAFLPIDIDPIRNANSASTDAEHQRALEFGKVTEELFSDIVGDARPFIVDSGNGCQLLYPMDRGIPEEEAEAYVKKILAGLHVLFESPDYERYQCECDTSVSNPSRIMRLPGTWNCKGENTVERPHRQARLLSAPRDVSVGLTAQQLGAILTKIASHQPPAEATAPADDAADTRPEMLLASIPPERAKKAYEWAMAFMNQHYSGVTPDRDYASKDKAGNEQHGIRWAIQCPMEDHVNQSACVILWEDGHVIFKCQHDHCHHYGWEDFVRKVATNSAEADRVLSHTIGSNLKPATTQTEAVTNTSSTMYSRTLQELLVAPSDENREEELIQHNFLCKGQVCMLVAETGIGKSALVMQMAICWSMGKPCFGMVPERPLRILIVQGENCDDDLRDEIVGITAGLRKSGQATDDELNAAVASIRVITETELSGKKFLEKLEGLLLREPADIVIEDPFFQFFNGESTKQKQVSDFLRRQLNPMLQRTNAAMLLVHHTNKMSKAKMQSNEDYMTSYDGSGSSELSNFVRGILRLTPKAANDGRRAFLLEAAKRGERLGWTAKDGNPTQARWVCWSDEGIFWQDAPEELVLETTATARRQNRQREEKEKLEQTKLVKLRACLKPGKLYSRTSLTQLLVDNKIETSTSRQCTLISQAQKKHIITVANPSSEERERNGIARNVKECYRLNEK